MIYIYNHYISAIWASPTYNNDIYYMYIYYSKQRHADVAYLELLRPSIFAEFAVYGFAAPVEAATVPDVMENHLQ